MGRSKAMLPFGGRTIVEGIISELAGAFAEVVLVTSKEATPDPSRAERAGARIVTDREPFQGPVGAIADGLRAITCEAAFVCSCDLPLIRSEVAVAILAELGNRDYAAPEIAGRIQPLYAAYRRRCLGEFAAATDRGERRLLNVIAALNGRLVAESRLRLFDRTLQSFTNVNTPHQYRAALAMLSEPSLRNRQPA
jgi:molybdopterin-guanine dinucleotide biosynthesis protein A